MNELQKKGQEAREWNRIKNFRMAEAFETFLQNYPNGRFAIQARRLLNELQKEGQEAREWNRIKNFRTAGAFETFLKDYPNGRFAVQAGRRLKELRKPASAEMVEASLGLDRSNRRLVQLGLSAAGFSPGGADGVFGPQTRAAIRRWQSSRGTSSSGYLDARSAETLRSLGRRHNQPGEIREWNRIKHLSYAANFEAFLRDYPNGRFASEARRRLNQLRKPVSPERELRHGTKTYSDGRYVGQLRGDKKHGRGTFTWSDGDRYEGDWRDDKRTGRGTYTWPGDSRYEGEWRDSDRSGHGTMIWASGNRYEGQWRDDKRNGRGTFTWTDGDRYDGQWRDNKPHGQGTFTEPDGTRDVGQWRNGCFGERGGDWRTVNASAEACGFE